jgi:hypothetical protein
MVDVSSGRRLTSLGGFGLPSASDVNNGATLIGLGIGVRQAYGAYQIIGVYNSAATYRLPNIAARRIEAAQNLNSERANTQPNAPSSMRGWAMY